ncbi:UNVERIFIED_CONTAM: Histidine protein methyltransferase 1 [Sesamum indicum]
MESKQSDQAKEEIFRLFDEKPTSGLGFLDAERSLPPPPPPCLEVLASEVSPSAKYTVEPVNIGGLTLFKEVNVSVFLFLGPFLLAWLFIGDYFEILLGLGRRGRQEGRVSTQEVFTLTNSDLVPGKYEGGLKLWEGSLDLITTLSSEMQDGRLSFTGKRVLEEKLIDLELQYRECGVRKYKNQNTARDGNWPRETGSRPVWGGSGMNRLGCGHGLPGIFACLKGASLVHFQDFNSEVLQYLTIPNVAVNIEKNSQCLGPDVEEGPVNTETRFFSGDWGEVHHVLSCVCSNEYNIRSRPQLDQAAGYDVILMAETVYSISALPNLYKLIKKCLSYPHGVVYMAAKKYYFGVGGGSRRFLALVEKDGAFVSSLVAEVADGSSNVREVWKLHLK